MDGSQKSESKDFAEPSAEKKPGGKVWNVFKGIGIMKKHSKDTPTRPMKDESSNSATILKAQESYTEQKDEASVSGHQTQESFSEENVPPDSEKKETQKLRENMNIFQKTFDTTKSLLTGMAPQGLLFEILEQDTKRKERKAASEATDKLSADSSKASPKSTDSFDDNSSPKSVTDTEVDDKTTTSKDRTPKLITPKRLVIGNEESPAFRFLVTYFHYFAHLFYFQEWWTYPVFILLLLNPMPMLIAIGGFTGVCAFCSVLYDFILALTHGANLEEVFRHYWGLAKQEWVKFQAPEQRRKYIIVAGMVLRALPTIKKMAETYT